MRLSETAFQGLSGAPGLSWVAKGEGSLPAFGTFLNCKTCSIFPFSFGKKISHSISYPAQGFPFEVELWVRASIDPFSVFYRPVKHTPVPCSLRRRHPKYPSIISGDNIRRYQGISRYYLYVIRLGMVYTCTIHLWWFLGWFLGFTTLPRYTNMYSVWNVIPEPRRAPSVGGLNHGRRRVEVGKPARQQRVHKGKVDGISWFFGFEYFFLCLNFLNMECLKLEKPIPSCYCNPMVYIS